MGLKSFKRCPQCGFQAAKEPHELTTAEEDLVTLLLQGYSPKRISLLTGASYQGVRNDLSVIYAKLGVVSAFDLVAQAFKQGALDLWQYEDRRKRA